MSTLTRTIRKFFADGCTDLAAALTYYSVLAIFPAALALLSVLGLFGEAQASLNAVLDVLRPLVSDKTLENVEPTLRDLITSGGASVTFVIGVLGALWSASAYVGAFSRAMNKVRDVEETRPFWKLRPLMLLVTLVSIVLVAAALLIIVVSGPIATSIGDRIGLGDTALTVWNIAKWPVLAVVVVVIVTLLQRGTPNCRRLTFHWLTLGAFLSIVIWLAASVGFAFFVANFSSYNKTYGSVAGVIVALLWLWLTNLALLFGAELDVQVDANAASRTSAAESGVPYPNRKTYADTPSVLSGPDEAHAEQDRKDAERAEKAAKKQAK